MEITIPPHFLLTVCLLYHSPFVFIVSLISVTLKLISVVYFMKEVICF